MKKFFKFLLSIIISAVACLTVGCTATYSIAGCADKCSREIGACACEGFACYSDCFGIFTCSQFRDCYDEVYVATPLACADCIRNNYDDDATSGCMSCVEEGVKTYISNDDFMYEYSVDYTTDGLPQGYYKAIVSVTLKSFIDVDTALCTYAVKNSDGTQTETKLYFGNLRKNKSVTKKSTFIFKGYTTSANVKITSLYVGGTLTK